MCDSLADYDYNHDDFIIYLFQYSTPLSKFRDKFRIYSDINLFLAEIDYLISFIPIWELVKLLHNNDSSLSSVHKIVAISSTSALTKVKSTNSWERNYAQKFLASENSLLQLCSDLAIPVSIIRPTMIWGNCRDLNVSFMQRVISRYGFFILPAFGSGLRWPIHHSDLLEITFDTLKTNHHGIFIARGRQELSYR